MNFRKSIFKFWSIAAAVGIAAACTNVDAEDIDLVKLGALEKEFIVEADANSFDIDIYTNVVKAMGKKYETNPTG